MLYFFKKILFIFIFNTSLFLLLMIGIQNSKNSRKVNLISIETIKLPISFIIGLSFISGSLSASFLTTDFRKSKR